jgi:hemolysin activation/secretion protein
VSCCPKGLASFFIALVATCGVARAQTVPTPGSVQESISASRIKLPASPAQILLPDQPGPTVHDRNGPRFQIHSFRLVGNTVFDAQRLKRVVERYLDLELNLYDLNVAADAITEFYHDRGYSLARAVIPAQRVDDGVVTVALVEGRIGQVIFSGNKSYTDGFLAPRSSHLAPGSLVLTDAMERTLLLLNDLPGFKVRGTLAPGVDFGTSDVLVKAEEKRFGFNLTVDNAGRKETGEQRVDMGVEFNNPLGIGDQLTLRGMNSDQKLLRFGKLGYSIPLDSDGMRLAVGYSLVRYDVAGAFAALGLEGSSETVDLTVQYPLTRTRGKNETLTATVRSTLMVQSALGVETSRVRVPMLTLGYLFNSIGQDASVSNVSTQVSTNFQRNSDGRSTRAQRFRLEVDGNYLLPLDKYWDVYLRGAFVYSPDTLPDSEKYSVGGPGSVRAYRSSELRGDSGHQGTIEFRRSLMLGKTPGSLSFFADNGRAIYKAPGFSNGWESIAAIGAGISIFPFAQTVVKIEAATPQGGKYRAADGEKSRLWASVSTSF